MPENDEPQPAPTPEFDAAIVPAAAVKGATAIDRHKYFVNAIGRRIGADKPMVRNHGTEYFVCRGRGQSLQFPKDHPRHPEPRYDWTEPDGAGVRFGKYVKGANDKAS